VPGTVVERRSGRSDNASASAVAVAQALTAWHAREAVTKKVKSNHRSPEYLEAVT